ncbi:hypothetical protein BASA60_009158 [Batrachochytrium salamandrivorans]|nr:hypothetical protein BASA60_009158 [Batrachochytrium salamandrivorans]
MSSALPLIENAPLLLNPITDTAVMDAEPCVPLNSDATHPQPKSQTTDKASLPLPATATPRINTTFLATQTTASMTTPPLAALDKAPPPPPTDTKAAPAKSGKPVNPNLVRLIFGAAGISKRKLKPLLPVNGLSIVERHFHHSSKGKHQVIMGVHGKLRLPPQAKHISENRMIDILRLAQAQHYRLSSYVDYETQTAHLLADKASDLQPPLRFVDYIDSTTWIQTLNEEINAIFDVHDKTKPLWRIAMTAPREWRGDGISLLPESSSEDASEGGDNTKSGAIPKLAREMPSFDIVFTFHHCIGDGLSMMFLSIPVPPPLLDNLIKTNAFGVIPPATGLIRQHIGKGPTNRFKGLHLTNEIDLVTPSFSSPPDTSYATSPMYANGFERQRLESPHPGTIPEIVNISSLSLAPAISPSGRLSETVPASYSTTLSETPHTNLRLTLFNSTFVQDLRSAAKKNKTTVASVMIVVALAATRATFAQQSRHLGMKLPTHQGWVVTTSMRHLIPGSQLLNGADKQADPSTKVFGGYGGSISDPSMRLVPTDNLWERSCCVRKRIGSGLFTSMRRMKLANWCFRHPKVWQFLEKRADLGKLTRTFSVEMANLGAWDYDCAAPDVPEDDQRFRLDRFGGTLNSSFEGSRALFSLGAITIGSDMSVTVGYDQSAVSDAEADVFVSHFNSTLDLMRRSSGKILLSEMDVPKPI